MAVRGPFLFIFVASWLLGTVWCALIKPNPQQLAAFVPTSNVLHVNSGREMAKVFNSEINWCFRRWHIMQNVQSEDYGFVYIDNIEPEVFPIVPTLLTDPACHFSEDELDLPYTGTGTTRGGTSPVNHDPSNYDPSKTTKITHDASTLLERESTNGLPVDDYFAWSIVRDPLYMFQNQVKALHESGHTTLTADELLDQQLHMCNATAKCQFVNQHLQPSSWRLGSFMGGSRIKLDFIVRAENFDVDWPQLLDALPLLPATLKTTLAALQMNVPTDLPAGDPARLSDEWIRRLCSSEVYGSDWDYFGYARPEQCQLAAVEE